MLNFQNALPTSVLISRPKMSSRRTAWVKLFFQSPRKCPSTDWRIDGAAICGIFMSTSACV